MNIFSKYTFIAVILITMVSCKKNDRLNVTTAPQGLGGEIYPQTKIDKWLYENLTVPYNIATYYKWSPGQFPVEFNQVPPSDDKIIPTYQAIIATCFEPYNQQTGSKEFLKRYLPKILILAGSNQYLSNGTYVLGTAESGTSITFFDANNFSRSKDSPAFLEQMVHTMHHEFAHILHQNVLYPKSFREITGFYTSSWNNITERIANTRGYVTNYAMSSPDEDFVETISTMLTLGETEFKTKVLQSAGGPGSYGYNAIRAKETAVVEYFSRVWKIDFYALQKKTRTAYVDYLQ